MSIDEVEIADAERGKPRHLPWIVRNLETVRGVAEDRAHTRLRIEHCRGVAEEVALVGAVMDRIITVSRILDAEITGEAATGDKIFRVAATPAVVEARR